MSEVIRGFRRRGPVRRGSSATVLAGSGLAAAAAVGLTATMLVAPAASSASPPEDPVPALPAPLARAAAARTDYRDVVATLKAEIPAMMAQLGTVGATVALVDGDRVILARGFGWADRARRRPVTARTRFHIGSLSKTFTALAVMQLVEQGRVDLDAPLADYVPEFALLSRSASNRITVRSVLDHHSGIPGDMFNGMITLGRPDRHFPDRLLRALRQLPPERRVNTGWAYNNSGFVLLRLLVERVTGKPFADRTARTLFERMGMRHSTFDDSLAPDRVLTRNYAPVLDEHGQPTGRTRAGPREYVNGWTAGSILSSASDMTEYLRTLVNGGRGAGGRIVQAGTLRRMMRPQTRLPIDMGARIGLSWFVADGWMGRTVGHDGATTRNFSMLTIHPAQRLGVFVSTNTVGGSALASAVADRAIALAYTAKTGVPQPPPVRLPTPAPRVPTRAELAAAAGIYAGFTDHTRIRVEGDRLVMTTFSGSGATTQTLTALTGGWWSVLGNPDAQVTFRTVPQRSWGDRPDARGRRLLLERFGGGDRIQQSVLGERLNLRHIPQAWRRAAGTYRADLDAAHATDLVARGVELRVHDGFAELILASVPSLGRQALQPVDGHRAFTRGWSDAGGRRKGDLVRLDGNTITYMGVEYRRHVQRKANP